MRHGRLGCPVLQARLREREPLTDRRLGVESGFSVAPLERSTVKSPGTNPAPASDRGDRPAVLRARVLHSNTPRSQRARRPSRRGGGATVRRTWTPVRRRAVAGSQSLPQPRQACSSRRPRVAIRDRVGRGGAQQFASVGCGVEGGRSRLESLWPRRSLWVLVGGTSLA